MWRFLHYNIPRAFKTFHAPRTSVGVYVETDDKDQDVAFIKQEKESQVCVAQSYDSQQNGSNCPREGTLLWRLTTQKKARQSGSEDRNQTNKEEEHNWWHSCSKDVKNFLQGQNHFLEAIVGGSTILWGGRHNDKKKNGKLDLIYRVLSPCCDNDVKHAAIQDTSHAIPPSAFQPQQKLLAIKDAEGAAQDGAINKTKSESLEMAMKEFEHMCHDYTAHNESLLGIIAAEDGDMPQAMKHFRTSCSMGNKTACFNLGLFYETGKGVSQDLDKAKHFYRLAAAKGHSEAMYNLALLHLDSGQHGDVRARGLRYMAAAARAGLMQAQTYMGVYHMQETGHAKMAAAYFRAAADQNDREALYFLALCHQLGLGLEVNECKAAQLFSQAAGMGHDGAMFNLANFIQKGLGGIPSDEAAALKLFTKAAELGNQEARLRVKELTAVLRKKKQVTSTPEADKDGLTPSRLANGSLHHGPSSLHPSPSSTNVSSDKPSSHRHPSSLHRSLSSINVTLKSPAPSPSNSNFFLVKVKELLQSQQAESPNVSMEGAKSGKIQFHLGSDLGMLDIDVSAMKNKLDSPASGDTSVCFQCLPLHKSSTSPNLSSRLACHI